MKEGLQVLGCIFAFAAGVTIAHFYNPLAPSPRGEPQQGNLPVLRGEVVAVDATNRTLSLRGPDRYDQTRTEFFSIKLIPGITLNGGVFSPEAVLNKQAVAQVSPSADGGLQANWISTFTVR